MKKKLDDQRNGKVRAVNIGNTRLYMQTGEYKDGTPGELFLTLDKQGSELRAYDLVAIAVSIGLQWGVPLEAYTDKYKYQQMEPSGVTNDPDIPIAKSIIDYVAQKLEMWYPRCN